MEGKHTMADKRDIHAEITAQLIEAIEAGAGKFEMPWHAGHLNGMPYNGVTKNAYNGVNVLSLWLSGRSDQRWASYRQWQKIGAQVKKGERATTIVYYKQYNVTPKDDDDTGRRFVLRWSSVFNAEQCDNVPALKPRIVAAPFERNVELDAFVARTGIKVQHGGNQAYYSPSLDLVNMPPAEAFRNVGDADSRETYYGTLMHELVHASGAKHRLDRLKPAMFGTSEYAFEELVAEIGSAFLCSELGISPSVRQNHACYLASWLKALREDKKAIFRAASLASKASAYLQGKTASTSEANEEKEAA